jgi:hypothetical protein
VIALVLLPMLLHEALNDVLFVSLSCTDLPVIVCLVRYVADI